MAQHYDGPDSAKDLNEEKLKEFADKIEKNQSAAITSNVSTSNVGSDIQDTSEIHKPWHKKDDQIQMANQIGWQQLSIKDLPTQGLFYPDGTEIVIRSASAGEIRHWSTLNEDDLSALDDMLNYIIERCAKIKYPNKKMSSWKDIKEIDRFYILLAIREFTFVDGENKLQVKTSETSKVDVTKDMVDYITFDPRLMKYYDQEKRIFILKFKSGKTLPITIPSVGITNWLKNYIIRKRQLNEIIDEDFISFAPFVMMDWRGLNDDTYSKIVIDSHNWSPVEISMLNEIRNIFADAVEPVVKYKDEEGAERTVPLSFQGGIKSIFLISMPFNELV